MTNGFTKDLLYQRWVHSHEEDTETEMVFRPATYNFPRSRGRSSFELKQNGTLLETGIGPTDIPKKAQGTWKIKDGNILYLKSTSKPVRKMHIAYVDKNRMILKK